MSENYRSKVQCVGTYLYRNNLIEEDLTGRDTHENVELTLYIPNVGNIDLEQFRECYFENDTEKERPVYVKLYRSPDYDAYLYPQGDQEPEEGEEPVYELGDISQKLNLGDNRITFITLNNSLNAIGNSDILDDTSSKYSNLPYKDTMYSLCSPFTKTEGSSFTDYLYSYVPDVPQSQQTNFVDTFRVLKNCIDGEKIEGLPYKLDLTNDRILIPYNIGEGETYNCFNMFKDTEEMTYKFGCSPNVTTGGGFVRYTKEYNGNTYRLQSQRNQSTFNMSLKTNDGTPSTVEELRGFFLKPNELFPNVQWEYYTLTNNNQCAPLSYSFLSDDNKEVWMLCITAAGIKTIQEGTDPVYPGTGVFFYTLFKVKDMIRKYDILTNTTNPFGFPSVPDSYRVDYSYDINDAFNKLLFLEEYTWDDEAPDIEGGGDPYDDEEFDNTLDIIGGDSDIKDDINEPDTSPNVSYDSFVVNNGLFGSYRLTTSNLQNYTETLQKCRENSFGGTALADKFMQMGNLIQENTVSLIALPLSIPDSSGGYYNFNIGTKAVRKSGSDWSTETSVDSAFLIKNITGEYTVELGTLKHYYDNYLDFSPYSSASLYIPYIGKVEIPINLIQSTSKETKNLKLIFRVNRTNGDLLVLLTSNNIPLCRWTGNCSRSIPLSYVDNSSILRNSFNRLTGAFSSLIGGATAITSGNIGGMISSGSDMIESRFGGQQINTSSHLIGSIPESGEYGWLDGQDITLIVERPIWWKPYDYSEIVGYPTKKTAKLGSIKGFARVSSTHIRCSGTEEEKEEIKNLLKEGCIF